MQSFHVTPNAPDTTGPNASGPDENGAESALEVDTVVSSMANLIFATTGPAACASLAEVPDQITLTPVVALRVAAVLRDALQYPDLGSREAVVSVWQAEELMCVPHGRVVVDRDAVRVGIEPIGAGTLVATLWEHVPAFIWQLEWVAQQLRQRV